MKSILFLVLAAGTSGAQWMNVQSLAVGQEIRVSLADGKSFRGQVQSVTDESLIVVAANSQQTLPRAEIRKVATKADSHRMRNTFIGLGIGAGAGVAIGAGTDSQCSPHCFIGNNLGKEILTPLGAVIGTIIGVAWPTGLWHNVYRSK